MTNHDRYLACCRMLFRRYCETPSSIVTHRGGKPTRYRVLCEMAAAKYLGSDMSRLEVPTNTYVRVI